MKLTKLLLAIPTTKVRIVVSICLTVWTAYHVLERGWTPSWEWLVFLAANSGLDIAQYRENRIKSEHEYELELKHTPETLHEDEENGESTASSDLRERRS